MDETHMLCVAVARRNLFLAKIMLERRKRSRTRTWVRKVFLGRSQQGQYHSLLPILREHHPDLCHNFHRMTPSQFDYLVNLITPIVEKQRTNMREPLSPAERLNICLRFLATGDSYASLQYGFLVGKSTISEVIPEVCNALWSVLEPMVLKVPNQEEWRTISERFEFKWDFPNCVGAVDGKHVTIQAPAHSGSAYYNHKGQHSLQLIATCDADYQFTVVNIGDYGRMSDSGIFSQSAFGQALERDVSFLPTDKKISPASTKLPHVFLGDEGFGLKKNFLRPFSRHHQTKEQAIFNYRLSRARRCTENAFGIMSARWRVLRKPILLLPANTTEVVQACCVLQNYLMRENGQRKYCPPGYGDLWLSDGQLQEGVWRSDPDTNTCLRDLLQQGSNHHSRSAAAIREEFSRYFNNEGAVSWQRTQI